MRQTNHGLPLTVALLCMQLNKGLAGVAVKQIRHVDSGGSVT